MKRLNMIAPFEVLRGNVSGEQKLQYATRNNAAFDAPNGKQYARNYKPRYICAVRSSDGRAYFHVKTKSATVINAASLHRMALLGGSGALYAAVLKDASVLAQAEGVYAGFKSSGLTQDSFRKWLMGNLRMILAGKVEQYIATFRSTDGTTFNLRIDNPWVKTSGEPNCPVSKETLVKFWPQLATNPIVFTVDGRKGVAHEDETFGALISGNHNVLDLESVNMAQEGEGDDYVIKIGELFVNYIDGNNEEVTCQPENDVEGIKYFLSETREYAG